MTREPSSGIPKQRPGAIGLEYEDVPEWQIDPDGRPPLRSVTGSDAVRRIRLTPASAYKIERVRWLWEGRIACGALSLLAGREGLGKSTAAYWIAARITRGELPGEFEGHPRAVLVCATEDSWESTIVPRLVAAGANLDMVFNVEVANEILGVDVGLTLPVDMEELERNAAQTESALLLLDPLMSRLSSKLDTHKDAEVRIALEPLTRTAQATGMAVLALIHLNKGGSGDPLNSVMGSKAFAAVARSVNMVVPDPDDQTERRRLFGTPKNNLGRTDLPLLSYTIESQNIPLTDNSGWTQTGRIEWGAESEGSIRDAMSRDAQDTETKTAVDEAGDWLEDYLCLIGGEALSRDAKKAGKAEGHSEDSLKRSVRRRPNLAYRSERTPRVTIWYLVEPSPVGASQSVQPLRGDAPTAPTAPTGADLRVYETTLPLVGAVGAVGAGPREGAPIHSNGDPHEGVPDPTDAAEPLSEGWRS